MSYYDSYYDSLGVRKGRPIFVFKYTGSTADLFCETLVYVDKMLKLKRSNFTMKEPLFPSDIVADTFQPKDWLWVREQDDLDSCHLFNILVNEFPSKIFPIYINIYLSY